MKWLEKYFCRRRINRIKVQLGGSAVNKENCKYICGYPEVQKFLGIREFRCDGQYGRIKGA